MAPAQGQAVRLSATVCHRAEPSQLSCGESLFFQTCLYHSFFSSSFCLIILTKASGNFCICVSDTLKLRIIAFGLTKLPDPPDAPWFLMELFISLTERLSTGRQLHARTAGCGMFSVHWVLSGWVLSGWT